MKLNLRNDSKPLEPKALRARIRLFTLIAVLDGLAACIQIENGEYAWPAISIALMLTCVWELTDLWGKPCNSSR